MTGDNKPWIIVKRYRGPDGKIDYAYWEIRQVRLTKAMAVGDARDEQGAIAAARREAAALGFDNLLVEHRDFRSIRGKAITV